MSKFFSTASPQTKVKMMQAVWGESWWGRKKRKLQDDLEERRRHEEQDRLADSNRLEAMRQRRIKRKMGACKYFCWPCGRAEYDKMFPRANVVVVDPAVEEAERLRKVLCPCRHMWSSEYSRLEHIIEIVPGGRSYVSGSENTASSFEFFATYAI